MTRFGTTLILGTALLLGSAVFSLAEEMVNTFCLTPEPFYAVYEADEAGDTQEASALMFHAFNSGVCHSGPPFAVEIGELNRRLGNEFEVFEAVTVETGHTIYILIPIEGKDA